MVALERTLLWQTEVVGLNRGQLGQLDVELSQMGPSDLLVKRLGEHAVERTKRGGVSGSRDGKGDDSPLTGHPMGKPPAGSREQSGPRSGWRTSMT